MSIRVRRPDERARVSPFGGLAAGLGAALALALAPSASAEASPALLPEPLQPLAEALSDPRIQVGLAGLRDTKPETVRLLSDLAAIVSPSGEERARAERVAEEMRRMGLSDVRVDASPNAVGRIPGRSGRALVFISTLDDLVTVAEHQRAAVGPPRVEGDRLVGPGTNTSSITAAMLAAARAHLATGVTPEHDLVFAAVAQEETGLLGMRTLYEAYHDRAVAFVDILGDGRSVSYGALGIHWWRVEGEGPPGHSLGGGLPNVNHGLARAVDRIFELAAEVQDPATGTVVNVAMLRSGAVFNHKPAEGWFSLDLRSLEAGIIAEMEAAVARILESAEADTGIRLRMVPFELTPGGQIPGARGSGLVRSTQAIARHLGFEAELSNAGASNMNVALAGGTPAIGLGGPRGGDRGQATEWADIPAMMRAAEHVLLLAVMMAGVGESRSE